MIHRLSAVVALAVLSSAAGAQRPETILRVQVIDSVGASVVGADVAVLRGLKEPLSNGATDRAGFRRFVVPRGDEELEIVARKIGFQRGDRFFRPDRDTISLVVRLRPTTQALPAVQVTAQEDLNRKRFHVDADDIAASARPILNGLDVITKLRPDMMTPPGGEGINPGTRCGLYYLWINGTRVVFPPVDPALAIRASQEIRAARMAANRAAGRKPHYTPLSMVPVTVQSALAKIHPEHIDEINYVDCKDTKSTDFARGNNAVFVVLKPGVGYDPVRGSYVLDHAQADSIEATRIAEATGADSAAGVPPTSLPAYRHRLVGAFDGTTGLPITGVEVVDLATGTFARTTPTGTATLAFLPEGSSTIELRRAGYAALKLDVAISPRDTIPLMLLLTPKKP